MTDPSTAGTYLVGCDKRSDTRVFSGSTYHLALQGVQDGLLTRMVNLYPRGIGALGILARAGLWKLGGGFRGRHGFIYSDAFLDGIWKRHLSALRGSTVINNFQMFGSYFAHSHRALGIEPYFYIDGTLREYFGGYGAFDTAEVDKTAIRRAFSIEREGYAIAHKIVVMSRRTAADIVEHYGVPLNKLHIVPPGANIPERMLETLDSRPPRRHRPGGGSFVVGFIGLYPERKGLPTVADAVQLLRRAGYDIHLHIIGKCPPEISQQKGVTYHGLIDKSVDMDRFVEIVSGVDIGCMLSRAELTGIALLEFLRMGVPIFATDVGGIPDIVELGAGEVVSPEISADELAQRLAQTFDQQDKLADLRERAWRRRHNASWRRVVQDLKRVVGRCSPAETADAALSNHR